MCTRKFLYGMSIILTIFICGSSFNTAEAYSSAQKKLMARRAARLDALRNLTETIYGTKVSSDTSVEDMVVRSDKIRTRLDALIKGAIEVDHQFNEDGSVEIRMEIELGPVRDILGTAVQYEGRVFKATGFGVPPSDEPRRSSGNDSSSSDRDGHPMGAIGPR